MVHSPEIVVVHHSVLPCEGLRGCGKELHQAFRLTLLSRRKRPVGKPPEQREAQNDSQCAIDEEHPLKPDQSSKPVHLLEASTDKTDHSGGDLGGAEVITNPLAGAARGVEQSQVVAHAGPHAGDDDAEQEAQQLHGPGGAHGGEAHAYEADGEDDAGHPDTGAEPAHDEVGGAVEDDIRDVEQGQGGGGVARCQVQDRHEVMALGDVHGLGEPDVGADGGAEEVEDPEGWAI